MLDLSLFLNYWIFNAYLWVIAGILIIIIEFVLSGEGTIILPTGLACFFIALFNNDIKILYNRIVLI